MARRGEAGDSEGMAGDWPHKLMSILKWFRSMKTTKLLGENGVGFFVIRGVKLRKHVGFVFNLDLEVWTSFTNVQF